VHPSGCDPRGDLGGKLAGDLVGVAAQRQFAFAVAGVGVAGGDVPHRGLGLDGNELRVVVDGVDGAGGVGAWPFRAVDGFKGTPYGRARRLASAGLWARARTTGEGAWST
jgi:hypothetical protein